ncbi:MAG: PsiF family protein [Betaproteobacteria bacterium]|nr:PsiF family protein [Betaproteobacteria bacterium]MDH4325233.1 PsiF family protein [Betaproteobacteria bacterium]MDH5211726.1 PsiF family protein [Betaproteobacteria bacterium]
MKRLAALLCLAFAVSSPAQAQDKPSPKQAAQQERMKGCNKQAADKKLAGDERKKFMSTCLKGETPSAAQSAQQEKMKACNKQAGDKQLKGDERKKFMSACLKG